MLRRRALLAVWTVVLVSLAALTGGRAVAEDDAEPPSGPLTFDHMTHDFGRAGQEQELEAEFTYANTSDETLQKVRAIGDCGCYGVTLSKETLAPGDEGTLKVRFRTLMMSGRVSKRIRVLFGETPRPPITLALKLDVVAGVILDPGRIWFGDVLLGSQPEKMVQAKWHVEAGEPFEVTSVEVPGYDFDIRTETFEKAQWKGTAVTLAFKKAPPLGIFSATALLRTNHPDYPRISLPVTANVTGKVWVQSRTVYFGWVKEGRAKKTTILVKPFAKDVELGDVTARSRHGKVDVSVAPHPMKRPGWWRVTVAVPEGAAVGKLDDVVEVRTAVPGEEVTEIEVRGEVLRLGS